MSIFKCFYRNISLQFCHKCHNNPNKKLTKRQFVIKEYVFFKVARRLSFNKVERIVFHMNEVYNLAIVSKMMNVYSCFK